MNYIETHIMKFQIPVMGIYTDTEVVVANILMDQTPVISFHIYCFFLVFSYVVSVLIICNNNIKLLNNLLMQYTVYHLIFRFGENYHTDN